MNQDNPMYKCIRCESKDVSPLFDIKFGLHDWYLCANCAKNFFDWVMDKQADKGCGWSKEYFKRKYRNKV
jgi:DNA-directed RNA polymerase subunit RPC12/RpoP